MATQVKITGIKAAVGDYNRANSGGPYDPWYGYLMLDRSDGKVWCDVFYDLGHNWWNNYHSPSIIDLGAYMRQQEFPVVNMQTVRSAAEKLP